MPGPIGETIEFTAAYVPYVAAVPGFVLGAGLELRHQRQDREERLALSEAMIDLSDSAAPQPTRTSRALGVLLVGSFTGMTAALNAYAWNPPADSQTQPATVEVVVDASGATILNDGEAYNRAVRLTGEIGETEGVDVSALIARGGTVEPAETDEVLQHQPLGDAPIGLATTTGLDNIRIARAEADGGGIVIITAGHGIGNTRPIIRQAEEDNIPISVVNVAPTENTSDSTIRGLEELAEQTGGQYFSRQEGTAEAVIAGLEDSLQEAAVEADKAEGDEADWFLRIAGAVMAGGWLAYMKQRKHLPLLVNRTSK